MIGNICQWKSAASEIKLMRINFTKLHLAPAAQVPGPVWNDSSLSPHQASCAGLSRAAKVGKIIYFIPSLLLCKAPTPEFCLTLICGIAPDEATPQSSAQIQVSSSPEFVWMMKGKLFGCFIEVQQNWDHGDKHWIAQPSKLKWNFLKYCQEKMDPAHPTLGDDEFQDAGINSWSL